MSWVWKFGPDDANERYVLLKLADNANQDGLCWPSLLDISDCTRLSESTVRRSIVQLEKGGWLTVKRGLGRGKNSEYILQEKVSERKVSQGKVSHRKVSVGPIKGVILTNPPHPLLGEPSTTVSEIPEWVPKEAWDGWMEVRQVKKDKNGRIIPWTKRCAAIAIGKLERWRDEHYDLVKILDAATFGNWQGLYIPEGLKPESKFRRGDPNNPADWAAASFEGEILQ